MLQIPSFAFSQNYNSKRLTRLFDKPVERTYYVKERYYKGNLYVEGQAVQKIYSLKKRVELKKGPWKWYYRNGKVKDSLFYSDFGLPTGVEVKYNSDETIFEKIDYGTSTNFKIKDKNWLKAIPKDYTRTFYHKEPNIPKKTVTYLNKKKHGTWQNFDKNGNLTSEKIYENGKLKSIKKY